MAYFVIPANTEPRRCRGCGAVLYWIQTKKGKRLGVEVLRGDPDSYTPSRDHDGQGTAHWATCPKAAEFRRPRPAGPPREHRPRKDIDE